jgi:hypothetical protein
MVIQCHEGDNFEEDQSAIASCIATIGKAIRNKFDANPRQATQYAQGVRRRVYALRIAESIFRKGFHGAAREQRAECREPSQHGLYSALCSLLSALCSLLPALCSPHSTLLSALCPLHSALCSLHSVLSVCVEQNAFQPGAAYGTTRPRDTCR